METITIPKEKYEELLEKAQQLENLKNSSNSHDSEEINEEDFDHKEVKPEYLEKLERIEKEGYEETLNSVEEIRMKIDEDNRLLEIESDIDLANWEKEHLVS